MILALWVRRLLGKTCTQCKGRGWNVVGDAVKSCSGCIGTGIRLAENSEWWTQKRGVIREQRKKQ